MGKSDTRRAKIATTRQKTAARRQAERSAALLEQEMRSIADDLELVDARRQGLLTRRDQLVVRARAQGYSWAALARMAGTTHQALLKRLPKV